MRGLPGLIIDAYSHIAPLKFVEAVRKIAPAACDSLLMPNPPLYDMDVRFRLMDQFEGLVQVLTLSWPAVEEVADMEKSVDLARLANDSIAEMVGRYPDRFVGGIAVLPMKNVESALREVDRAIHDLGLKGIYVYSNVNGKPLDSPEFLPLYEKMSLLNLPIYIHPRRSSEFADYATENVSKYSIENVFGWPYETTAAMTRLVFSKIFDKYPDLKIVTHHCGGMVPYYEQRIAVHYDKFGSIGGNRFKYLQGLTKSPVDYFKMFYTDTAIHGNVPALMCARAFFSTEHLLFAADMPLGDRQFGLRSYRQTIDSIHQMDISEVERQKILADNARHLLRLPV